MMGFRLRQVAIVGNEYEETEEALKSLLDLDVAYRDPGNRPGHEAGVSIFGLRNFVMPVGNQFLEMVSPLEPGRGSAGGRFIERRNGPGGYMLLFQLPKEEYESSLARLAAMGVRVLAGDDISGSESEAVHIHPKDLPGCLVELRWCINEELADGDWWPVERDWRNHRRTEFATGIAGAEIQTSDPTYLAQRWADVLGQDLDSESGFPALQSDHGPIRFVSLDDGRPEGLGGIDICVSDPNRVLGRAEELGLQSYGDSILISGLRFRFIAE